MPKYHTDLDHLTDTLPIGTNAHVRWALEPSGRALAFVHGFGGSALETWDDFDYRIRNDAAFVGTDVFYFTYDSCRVLLSDSATALHVTLSTLFSAPHKLYGHMDHVLRRKPWDFAYKSALLVAHSAGAAVVRRALLDQCKFEQAGRDAWTTRTQTILFAPAHTGANIVALAAQVLAGLQLKPIEAVIQFIYPVLKDLKPNSPFLESLKLMLLPCRPPFCVSACAHARLSGRSTIAW